MTGSRFGTLADLASKILRKSSRIEDIVRRNHYNLGDLSAIREHTANCALIPSIIGIGAKSGSPEVTVQVMSKPSIANVGDRQMDQTESY
jgi:hypothetical protein